MCCCFLCRRCWSAKKKDISFFRLPRDEPRKSQWIQFFVICAADITKIYPSTVICSEHFKPDCFRKYMKSSRLKEDAVPSIIVHRLKYAKIPFPEVKWCISSTSTCLEGIVLEGSGEELSDLTCDEENLPSGSFPSTKNFLIKPSETSKSVDVMVQATVSDNDDTPSRLEDNL